MEPKSKAINVMKGETAVGAAAARKREVNPDTLPFVLSETLPVMRPS